MAVALQNDDRGVTVACVLVSQAMRRRDVEHDRFTVPSVQRSRVSQPSSWPQIRGGPEARGFMGLSVIQRIERYGFGACHLDVRECFKRRDRFPKRAVRPVVLDPDEIEAVSGRQPFTSDDLTPDLIDSGLALRLRGRLRKQDVDDISHECARHVDRVADEV